VIILHMDDQTTYSIEDLYLMMNRHLFSKLMDPFNTTKDFFQIYASFLDALEIKYSQILEDVGSEIYKIEKRLNKKWNTDDKVAMGVSFGLVYPLIKKYQRQDRKYDQKDLFSLREEFTAIENYQKEIKQIKEKITIKMEQQEQQAKEQQAKEQQAKEQQAKEQQAKQAKEQFISLI